MMDDLSLPHPSMRILALVPGGIGDQILGFPTLQTLHQAYPDASLEVVAPPKALGAYRVFPAVTHTIPFDFTDRNSLADWGNLLGSIRERQYDLAISLQDNPGFFLWLTGIPVRIGFGTGGSLFLTGMVPPWGETYRAAVAHTLLTPLGLSDACPRPALTLAKKDIEWAEGELQRLGLAGKGYVLVQPGDYPAAQWQELLGQLQAKQPDLPLVVLSQDAALLNGLRAVGVQAQSLSSPDPGRRAALIAAADLTLCCEGDDLQLAIASGTFTIALLGASQPEALVPPNDDKVFPLRATSGRLADITPAQILQRILGA